MSDVKQVILDYLADNGFDGLFSPDYDCACDPSDLAPCEFNCLSCQPGYRVPCDCGDHDFHIQAEKPSGEDT